MKSEYHIVHKPDGRTVEWWGEEVELNRVPQHQQKFLVNFKRSLFPFFHREDGPASISKNKEGMVYKTIYCVNGLLHRLDGPAVEEIGTDDNPSCTLKKGHVKRIYYVCGVVCTKEQFETPGFIDGIILEHA